MKVLKQTQKLAELRAKTDQQLLEVTDIHLSRGLAYVRQMAEAERHGFFQVAEKCRDLASHEYAEAERLQELLDTPGKTGRLDARFRQLRESLASCAVRSACA